MAQSFRIRSPEEQLAAEIRLCLRRGRWGDRLPGIVPMVNEFGVSRQVVEKAFALLEAAGELRRGGGRGEMRPSGKSKPGPGAGTLIVYSLHPEQRGSESLDILQAVGATMPAPVTFVRTELGETPDVAVARVLATDARTILLMHQPWGTGTRLTAEGRRVIMIGGDGPGAVVPLVAMNHESMVRETLRRTFAAGHTRVSFPLWRRKPATVASMRGWIADEYRISGLRHSPEFDAPIVEDDSGEAMGACIRELFRHTPPTALIFQNLPTWVAAVTTLARLRIRIPEDVSTVMLGSSRELAVASPSQAHLRYPVEKFVSEVRKMLRRMERGAPGGRVLLEPIWEPGGSLGPPKTGQP